MRHLTADLLALPSRGAWHWRVLGTALWLVLAGLAMLLPAGVARAEPMQADTALVLKDAAANIDAWSAVSVLEDAEGGLTIEQVLTRLGEFAAPASPHANLGLRRGAMWLRIPVDVPQSESGRWLFDIDYPSLDRADLYVVTDGRPVHQVRLGDTQNFSERPMRTRSHAAPLVLERGMHHDLLMRVETTSTMVLPISLVQIDSFNAREASNELLQGLLTGIGLCLFVYSLAQWVSLRDRMFLFYAVATSGSTPFFFAYYGLGPQHLWGESQWLTQNAAPFTVLIGLVGIFQFVPRALDVRSVSRRLVKVMQGLSGVAAITAAAFLLGLLSYRAAQTIATVLGPMPMLMMVHTAFVRWRRGDRAAGYMLVGWGVYLVGVVVMAMLLRGFVGANFWTQHAFQFALTFEMAVWMLVLGVRIDEIRAAAEAAHRERDLLHSMAHTDALTGLLNRRGLQAAAEPMLRNASPQHVTAIYLLDLDGFKPVNDTFGHDVGDELLKLVGRRLQAQLRVSDRVARLGGDEFVIAVSALPRETEAERVGQKLLAAFQEGFDVSGHTCRVGLTIGYALAPHDGRDLASLLKRADAAMYAGKQAGKNRVQRGAASAGLIAA